MSGEAEERQTKMCDEADKKFFDSCTAYVRDIRGDNSFIPWLLRMQSRCDPKSPMEKVFLTAFATVVEANTTIPLGKVLPSLNGTVLRSGIGIIPQRGFQDYRVDFWLQYWGDAVIVGEDGEPSNLVKPFREFVVEVDGHGFHDRDKEQRAYENRRKRALQTAGYFVFPYTGSEVNFEPMVPALECLAFLLGRPASSLVCPDIRRKDREVLSA
jgi:hypothetical protein